MRFSEFADACKELGEVPSKLKKVDITAELLKKSGDDLYMVATLLQGRVFPSFDEREVGLAAQSLEKIIAQATGFPSEEIRKRFSKIGDFGLVAEELAGKKKQRTLLATPLTVKKVFENLQKTAGIEGKGSQEKKFSLVTELITSAKPAEARFIVRATMGDLRIGVAEGIIRDAIAKAFLSGHQNLSSTSPSASDAKKEARSAVEWAWFLRPDYGEIAQIARDRGMAGLEKVKVEVGKPYHVLLAERSPGLKEALESFGNVALEYKYDGARVVLQKSGNKLWVFTRRLENITKQFPELHDMIAKAVHADECIIEGEMLGFNKETGKPMPFQFLSQRIKRKYGIEKMVKEIPIQINLFDIVYLSGKELFEEPLHERWKLLKGIIKPIKGKFQLAEHIETKDLREAESFYKKSLAASQEGLIVKNLDASYQPGRRVGYWLKVKPTLENLDLTILGATWGTGKRAGWFGSYTLGCRDSETGEFLECGMIGTGIKEKEDTGELTFKELTRLLKSFIVEEKGSWVKIKPNIVVEVAYEEIQKSPTYSSGYALRFPRVVCIRSDRNAEDIDDVKRIEKIFRTQKGKR